MDRFEIIGVPAETVAKRMLYLAWQASRVFGMGAFQDRGEQSEDQIWESMSNAKDYPYNDPKKAPKSEVDADYVFGRMMKLYFKYDATSISGGGQWRADYQSFCKKYPDFHSLIGAACESLPGVTFCFANEVGVG